MRCLRKLRTGREDDIEMDRGAGGCEGANTSLFCASSVHFLFSKPVLSDSF